MQGAACTITVGFPLSKVSGFGGLAIGLSDLETDKDINVVLAEASRHRQRYVGGKEDDATVVVVQVSEHADPETSVPLI